MKKYILRYKKNLILSVIFGVIEVYFIYLYCTVSTKIIDVVLGNIEGSASKIVTLSILYVLIACLSYYISQRNGKLFTQYICRDLRHDYLEGIINTKSSNFFGKDKGEYITQVDQNVGRLRLNYLMTLPSAIIGIGQAIVYIIGLYNIHPYILLATIFFVIFPGGVSKFFSKRISDLQILRSENYSSYIDRLNEFLDGYFVIKESKNKEYFLKKFDIDDNKLLKSLTHLNVSISMFGQTLFSINILSSLLVTYICSIMVKNQYLQLSDLLASLKLVSISTATLADSFGYLVNILSTKKIKEMVISEIPDIEESKREGKTPQLDLKLNNLSFAYGDIKVFDKMDLDIEKAKSYAIIGNSGSGKSTLAKILMKVNEDYGGEISFANGNFKEFSEEDLYDNIYYIPQNPIVFEDTFINNIAMGDDGIDKDRIEKIIDRVGLSRVYHEKKDGLIKNGSLSGGEKKKLELARALYKGSDLLIFDEPTSGLDPESARSIEGLIESLDRLTRIVITHNQDPSYLQSFDHVINIEDYKS